MKRKPIHPQTSGSQGGDKNKANTLKIASAFSSMIVSDAEKMNEKHAPRYWKEC